MSSSTAGHLLAEHLTQKNACFHPPFPSLLPPSPLSGDGFDPAGWGARTTTVLFAGETLQIGNDVTPFIRLIHVESHVGIGNELVVDAVE
jgi:hypothetical protein